MNTWARTSTIWTLRNSEGLFLAKKIFFVARIFSIFDKQKLGRVSLTEFVETVQQFSRDDDDAKIAFLFQVECSIII